MFNKLYFFFFVLFAIANHHPLAAADLSDQAILRVMTFNLWRTGTIVKDGPAKIMKHLNAINPCIVLFQECTDRKFEKILSDNGWNVSYVWDTTIATKYEIKSEQTYHIGATSVTPIFVPELNLTVIVVNEHLDYRYDGAETLLINKNNKTVEERIQSAMSNEKNLRLKQEMDVMADKKFQKMMADSKLAGIRQIIIIGGDLNTPSHLDWGEDTKFVHNHDNIVFEWPVTKLLEKNGFVDSYRAVHKNASEENGNTWSPVVVFNEIEPIYPEPQNRIDYLFYFDNGKVKAVNSKVYQGEKPVQKMPDHINNDWPSDHRAVFTDFKLMIDKE